MLFQVLTNIIVKIPRAMARSMNLPVGMSHVARRSNVYSASWLCVS